MLGYRIFRYIEEEINMGEELVQEEQRFECPSCHSDNVQRFAIAFQNGIADVNTTTAGIGVAGHFGVGAAKTKGTQQSALSMSVAPPAKKGYLGKVILVLFLAFIVGGMVGGTLGLIVNFLLGVGGLYLIYRQVYCWNRDVHPQLMDEWQHSFICLRCGHKFIL